MLRIIVRPLSKPINEQNMNYIPLIFDVSGGEFLVILLVILMFFGSKNIPDLARGLGKGYRQL